MNPPDVQKYLNLLGHDLRVLQLLSEAASRGKPPDDVSDWQVTILFYLACLYVKAVGCLYGKRFDDHISLRQWINSETDMLGIARDYRKLEEASRDARYEGRRSPKEAMVRVQIPRFETVRNHVVNLL
jgi:hypothetical protein